MRRVAVGPCCLHLNGLGGSVDPPKHEIEPARPQRLRSKVGAKIATQTHDHPREVFPVADGLGEGELAHLLRNRVYRGAINHKAQSHPGEHEPIIERALFEAVQARLDEQRRGKGKAAD